MDSIEEARGTDEPHDEPTQEQVESRLRELAQLYALGKALREARFVDPPRKPPVDRVRERPDEPA